MESQPELTVEYFSAVKLQSFLRRFIIRSRLLRSIRQRYEKIYDPVRKRYFYYDKETDTSSWIKPVLLLTTDLHISPTYTEDQAAIKIQTLIRSHISKLKVRLLYQSTIVTSIDQATGTTYYYNPKTYATYWELPKFMNGRFDYIRKPAKKIPKYHKKKTKEGGGDGNDDDEEEDTIDETESESNESDDDDDDSEGLSVNSETIREKRRLKRKYPR
jgi:hypothetical protein